MMMESMNKMFGKLAPGMCRLSMGGGIAVKTSNGYKSYDVERNRMTNCTNFVFDIGEEFFFLIPTNKVEKGDIILVGGKPKCVVSSDSNMITVVNYEDSTVENILPERHVFMGNTYFYGKVVSMFGDMNNKKVKPNKILPYMMMNEMMKGNNGDSGNNSMMAAMMFSGMMGGGMNMFGDMFNFDDEDEDNTMKIDRVEETEENVG